MGSYQGCQTDWSAASVPPAWDVSNMGGAVPRGWYY